MGSKCLRGIDCSFSDASSAACDAKCRSHFRHLNDFESPKKCGLLCEMQVITDKWCKMAGKASQMRDVIKVAGLSRHQAFMMLAMHEIHAMLPLEC